MKNFLLTCLCMTIFSCSSGKNDNGENSETEAIWGNTGNGYLPNKTKI